MKHTLLIITSVIFCIGCTESVTKDDLVEREGLVYKKFSEYPFTGEVIYNENEKSFLILFFIKVKYYKMKKVFIAVFLVLDLIL